MITKLPFQQKHQYIHQSSFLMTQRPPLGSTSQQFHMEESKFEHMNYRETHINLSQGYNCWCCLHFGALWHKACHGTASEPGFTAAFKVGTTFLDEQIYIHLHQNMKLWTPYLLWLQTYIKPSLVPTLLFPSSSLFLSEIHRSTKFICEAEVASLKFTERSLPNELCLIEYIFKKFFRYLLDE